MEEPNIKTLKIWEEKGRAGSPPFRFQFDQLDENIQFLVSFDPEHGHKIRCSGLFFDGLVGASVAGRTLTSLFQPKQQSEVNFSIEQVFSGNHIAKLNVQTLTEEFEILLLPLRAEHGPVEFAIGAISLQEMPEVAFPILTLLGCEVSEIAGRSQKKAVGFAEEKTGFSHKGAPKFRVIEGNPDLKPRSAQRTFELVHSFKREP